MSITRFAEVMGVNDSAIHYLLNKDILKRSKIDGRDCICFDTEKPKWDEYQNKPKRRRKTIKETTGELSDFAPSPKKRIKVKVDSVGDGRLKKENLTVGEVSDGNGNTIQINSINFEAFKDCWLTRQNKDGQKEYVYDEDGNPLIEWKKADQKCVALLRKQLYDTKAGTLVERADVVAYLNKLLTPLKSAIMQIPSRYATRIAAQVKRWGLELDNDKMTAIQNMMKEEPAAMLTALQQSIEEFMND